jgi:hypothetical protein
MLPLNKRLAIAITYLLFQFCTLSVQAQENIPDFQLALAGQIQSRCKHQFF